MTADPTDKSTDERLDAQWVAIKRINHQFHDDECEICRLLRLLDASDARIAAITAERDEFERVYRLELDAGNRAHTAEAERAYAKKKSHGQ